MVNSDCRGGRNVSDPDMARGYNTMYSIEGQQEISRGASITPIRL